MTTLTPESANDFSSVRQKAFIEEWLSFFTGKSNDLLSFEEVKHNLRLQDAAYKGLREIELDKIAGSVGRYRDFTRTFLPKSDNMGERWRRVDSVALDLGGLPPIDVYKVGDVYFVRDGNHRVSVARLHNAKTIEAYVTEYKTDVPVTKDDDLDDILLKMERTKFFTKTKLDKIRPDNNIEFTAPGRYRRVRGHIAFHHHMLELAENREIPYAEAVASWYDNVYMPVIKLIRRNNVLKNFPDRTEADLYAWLLVNRGRLEKEYNAAGLVPDEDLLETIKRERATNPFARFMGFFRGSLDLKNMPLKIERARFLEQTHLDEIRPEHGVRFTEPGCYQLAKHHIDVHQHLRQLEQGQEISYDEAVASWFDHVYTPVINLIHERGILKHFPKNTEADLYLWLVNRREMLEEEHQAMGQIPTEKVVWDLENEISARPALSLSQFFGSKLDLKSVVNGSTVTA